MKKIGAALLAGVLIAGSVSALDLARPAEAQAAGWCTADYNNNTVTFSLWNISCGSGGALQPFIKYYKNDTDPRVYTNWGVTKSSGSSAVSRPAGSHYADAGYVLR